MSEQAGKTSFLHSGVGKITVTVITMALALWVGTMPAPAGSGLGPAAMRALGIILFAIIFFVFEILPMWLTAVLMCLLWAIFHCVTFAVAFASFSGETIWLQIPALAIGAAAAKTGLLKRIALTVMKVFPATFKGQCLALMAAGTVIAPTIPSVTAKSVIAAPIAREISNRLGYEVNSPGASGLYSAMWTGFVCSMPAMLTAGVYPVLLQSLLPEAQKAQFTWGFWLFSMVPWLIVMLVLSYYAIQLIYSPGKSTTTLSKEYFNEQLAAMGAMGRDEKISAAVLVGCLILWMSEPIHHITACQVGLLGMIVIWALKVMNNMDFRTRVPWETIVMIGGIVNLGAIIPALKIDKWVGNLMGPTISQYIGNVWVFIPLLAIAIYLIRFFMVAQASTVSIFVVLLLPFCVKAGLNPFVMGIVIVSAVNVWHMLYQNTTHIAAMTASISADNPVPMTNQAGAWKMSVAYMAINVIALVASIPWWKIIGVI